MTFTTTFAFVQNEIGRTHLAAFTSTGVLVKFPVRTLASSVALAVASVQVKVESRFASFVAFTFTSVSVEVETRRTLTCADKRTSLSVN
jgi:hypothetical protein